MVGVVVGDQELSQCVFMVLYCMSSNQNLGASASESFISKEHIDLLLGKRLLDLNKFMDVCAIYGHDNEKLARSLVLNALKSQPRLIDELKEMVPQFLHIVETMHHRCCSALEALPSSRNNLTSRVR
jgi:activating signal cointegrator complex subunit 2